jgi:cytochrome c oxidase assembly factor CtaG
MAGGVQTLGMDVFENWPVLQAVLLVAAVAAVVFAFRAARPAARQIAWCLVFACWVAAMCSGGGDGAVAAVVGTATTALPPVALVAVAWRLPRGRADTVTAEIGLLVCVAISLWVVSFSSSYDATGEAPSVGVLVWFLFLAAAFVAAAVPVPSRRIAYGAAALSCVLLGVFREVLLWSETGQHPDVPFNDDLLVGAVYVGIPVVGVALQLLWWARRRGRG